MMKRRKLIIQSSLGMLATLPSINISANMDAPYFTTGIKIEEISSNTSIIWARLAQREVRVKDKGILPTILYCEDLVKQWHNEYYLYKK
jgi:phosphodiesterase/alkaline phosphatase D-like protein